MVNINNQAQKICPGTSNKTKAQTKCSQLLPVTVNLTRHKDSVDHTGQENIWFVGCLTTARATPASREGVQKLCQKERKKLFEPIRITHKCFFDGKQVASARNLFTYLEYMYSYRGLDCGKNTSGSFELQTPCVANSSWFHPHLTRSWHTKRAIQPQVLVVTQQNFCHSDSSLTQPHFLDSQNISRLTLGRLKLNSRI